MCWPFLLLTRTKFAKGYIWRTGMAIATIDAPFWNWYSKEPIEHQSQLAVTPTSYGCANRTKAKLLIWRQLDDRTNRYFPSKSLQSRMSERITRVAVILRGERNLFWCWRERKILPPVVTMTCITRHQTTSNVVCLYIRLVKAVPGEYVCQAHDSSRQ